MSKLHLNHAFSFLVLLFFVSSILYTWLTFPFSSQVPLKIFFQQRVEIDLGLDVLRSSNGTHGSHKMITSLLGHPRYLPNSAIISNLPSAQRVDCSSTLWQGLITCEWDSGSGMLPVPNTLDSWSDDKAMVYFNASVLRTGPFSARFTVKGTNTRSCKVYFDNQPIREYIVHPSNEGEEENKGMQRGFEVAEEGILDLRLWSRTWEREWVVDVKWGSGEEELLDGVSRLEGRVACGWAEYESAGIDHGSGRRLGNLVSGKIPAFEEVLMFLPEWAVASKAEDGLVEVLTPFSI